MAYGKRRRLLIGIVGDSPTITTGFGRTSRFIGKALSDLGWKVVYFGVGATECRREDVFPVPYYANLTDALEEFITTYSPSVIVFNGDIPLVVSRHKLAKAIGWQGHSVFHLVMNGTPGYRRWLQYLREETARAQTLGVIVPTWHTYNYLQTRGLKKLYYGPHGVDLEMFHPLTDAEKTKMRRELGVTKEDFLIGVFARNDWRKQIPLILEGISLFLSNANVQAKLYLHTGLRASGGWDLIDLIKHYGLEEHVIHKDIRRVEKGVSEIKFTHLLGSCDAVINVPCNGGFELITIESQAMGVPLITIDDGGNIKEVAGEGALLLKPRFKLHWINGEVCFFVSPSDIAQAIRKILYESEVRHELIERGQKNASKYRWSTLAEVLHKVMSSMHFEA